MRQVDTTAVGSMIESDGQPQAVRLFAAAVGLSVFTVMWFSALQVANSSEPLADAETDREITGQRTGDRSSLREPVFRVNKERTQLGSPQASSQLTSRERASDLGNSQPARNARPEPTLVAANTGEANRADAKAPPHPLDPALAIARDMLQHIEESVVDYTCVLVKRERVNGQLLDHEFMNCKIRHAREGAPFSVYLGFRKPAAVQGREVLYVDGQNDGKIIAHEGGFKGRFIPTVQLMPTSTLAMRGNRYPITEIGIETLTRRLIEKGERDRTVGDCKVRLVDGAKIDGRVCMMLEVTHPDRHEKFDFHKARIFMDKKLRVPIRYESYDWPVGGSKPALMEEYTYMNLKLNVGLTAKDFDQGNPSYKF